MAFTFSSARNADTGTKFPPIPAGEYEAQIENVTIQPFGGSDKIKKCDKLHIQLRIDLDAATSRKVWDDIYLDETHSWSMSKLKSIVDSAGVTLKDTDGEQEIANALIGELVIADVNIHEHNGKKKNQVSGYIVPEAKKAPAPSVEIDSDDLPF